MGRAFVIRPFGTKKDSAGAEIDFDRVHAELIGPAVKAAGLSGSTTGEIVEAGNIREDMFALLVESDLVVCDITILNANVFYELGIRHALRRKSTIMIKGQPTADNTPFDLLTDRYMPYDIARPGASVHALTDVIKASLGGDRVADSPLFQMLPTLPEADPENVQVVPADFLQEVRRAVAAGSKGWLRLLADEVRGQRFERSGLKIVGKALWKVKDYDGAREVWELIRELYRNDLDANLALANIYERLSRGDARQVELLAKSDEAVDVLLTIAARNRSTMAEARALKGRNQKTHWRMGLSGTATIADRRRAALNRALIDAYECYLGAFHEDLNSFYPGLNALQLGCVLHDLSNEPEWAAVFDDDKEAERYRAAVEERVASLRSVVSLSVRSALERLAENDPDRVWAQISEADALFLTETNDLRVQKAYERALAGRSPFDWDVVKGQLQLFADLGYKVDRAQKVIEAVDKRIPPPRPGKPMHLVVFAGHQVDMPDRPEPRFPAAKEGQARDLIKAAVQRLLDEGHEVLGLGSASPGADLLWHDVCRELGVRTMICLPMPVADHARVVFAGDDVWRGRFLDLVQAQDATVLTLSDRDGLPKWLEGQGLDPWARGNGWVLKLALTSDAKKITLLAFWDGKPAAPNESGTAQLVRLARDAGVVRVERVDSTQLVR